jgi:hypothetical protein
MSVRDELKAIWDAGLTDEEYLIIGNIVAQWGALEAEVFSQTLMTYGSEIHVSQLPKEMSNQSFSAVLDLWKVRIVDVSEGGVKGVLDDAYEKILQLKDVRNSIIHGMWDFSLSEPKTISTFRVKKDQLIHTTFMDGALADIGMKIAELNASIRYPGGLADFFKEQMGYGVYVNHAEWRRMKLKSNLE